MEQRRPWKITIHPGCIVFALVVIFIFWFGIRIINRCTEPEYHTLPIENVEKDTVVIHDTVYIDKTEDGRAR